MSTKPYTQEELKIKDSIQEVRHLFATNGINSDGVAMTISDTLATPNMPLAFKRVIEEYVIDAIEPNLIGTSLLQRITLDPYKTEVRFRTYGAMDVGDISMAEGKNTQSSVWLKAVVKFMPISANTAWLFVSLMKCYTTLNGTLSVIT